MPTREIAERQGLSFDHLAKVTQFHSRTGYVEASRGRNGGVRLTIPPAEISIGEVRAGSGPVPRSCAGNSGELVALSFPEPTENSLLTLTIRHRTAYRYRQPVRLGRHRLMLRPRETRDLRLISVDVAVTPDTNMSWASDVFGNAVATASFQGEADRLTIESCVTLDLHAEAWPVFDVAASAINYPFVYSNDEATDLGPLTVQQYPDPEGRLATWVRGFVRSHPTDTLSLLKDISQGVAAWVRYEVREDEGTQAPNATLERRQGSCRDFAVLFVEAARSLGFGARIVSGYLYNRDMDAVGSAGEGSTHAWAEIYLPGAGWVTFDPTNRSVGGFNLIPVAVARNIWQTMPVSGSFTGPADAFEEMAVEVSVTR